MSRRAALFAIAALGFSFGPSCRDPTEAGPGSTVASPSAIAPAPTSSSNALLARSIDVVPRNEDEDRLHAATLTSLTPRSGPAVRPGSFDAVVQTPSGRMPALAHPALTAAPLAYRAPYAFYRLGLALKMRVVPVTTVRAVPIAELGAALGDGQGDGQGDAPNAKSEQATRAILGSMRVQNDGTIDVLLASLSSPSVGSPWQALRGSPFDVTDGPAVATWDRWAGAPSAELGEDAHLLRDYLEMLVLDYLAANVSRQTAIRSGSAIVLAENGGAFPSHIDHPALDHLLRRLRTVARFPRGLRDALQALDRPAANRIFEGGAFQDWLLSPRTLVELDERRAALLTLIEARIAERGAATVLAL